jgi:hypothetical protein
VFTTELTESTEENTIQGLKLYSVFLCALRELCGENSSLLNETVGVVVGMGSG